MNLNFESLKFFRSAIHETFPAYSDATMDLIDALSTNQNARSVVELSENKFFRRKYASITKVIRHFLVPYKGNDTKNEEAVLSDVDIGKELAQDEPLKENFVNDYHPDKALQKMLKRQIFNFCCLSDHEKSSEKRNFFYLPVMSRQS